MKSISLRSRSANLDELKEGDEEERESERDAFERKERRTTRAHWRHRIASQGRQWAWRSWKGTS